MKKFFGLLLAAVMTFSLVACGAQNVPSDNTSADYPSGPITCIVPYAAGGGSDVLTRTIMKYISLPNNVNMVAVNVEGASGYTGCLQAAKSDPDGYTILAHNPMDVVGFTLSGSTTEELYKEMELICCVVNDYGGHDQHDHRLDESGRDGCLCKRASGRGKAGYHWRQHGELCRYAAPDEGSWH